MLNVETLVVIFDQQLWMEATEIVQTLDFEIVLILGVIYMTVSFGGSVSTLMSGSGLDTTLEISYDSNSVKRLLSGKSIVMFCVCLETVYFLLTTIHLQQRTV